MSGIYRKFTGVGKDAAKIVNRITNATQERAKTSPFALAGGLIF
jgi:hypothetical protein